MAVIESRTRAGTLRVGFLIEVVPDTFWAGYLTGSILTWQSGYSLALGISNLKGP